MAQNRLASEASPYLLQHADNPVDWYPWGPDALERAKKEDKPILLSIGYSACHWCHVMEHESFEDPDIARKMNELFVNVKVDREERPDLDQIYQLVVQVMGRSGGWPLTVFLTPEQRPFFAGTYFPPTERMGMPGFPRVLEAVADAYRKKRGEVEEQAKELTGAIADATRVADGGDGMSPELLGRAAKKLLARFDARYGGFGNRPKFPNTMALGVLLRHGVRDADATCRENVETGLDRMRAGGIWDHLRGGFHRYSTDERWLVPHFEKMLYDNALLLGLYADGVRVFGKPGYAETAREIVTYLQSEMRDEGGGFYSAQDADSEGHEGKFFVWTPADVEAALEGDARAIEVVRRTFDVSDIGNFEDSGATVLHESKPIERVAAMLDLAPEAALGILKSAKQKMLAYRERRPRPLRDDKILASWNALVISALADAGRALGEPTWVRAAEEAFQALERALLRDGRVGRYVKSGAEPRDRPGFLDDQAYFGNAALDLYEATGDGRYATAARAIADAMVQHHADPLGGFFFTPDDGEALIARTKDAFDHAIPSASAMAAQLCLRVAELCDAPALSKAGARQLELVAGMAATNAFGLAQSVLAIDRAARGATTVVLVGSRSSAETRALADVVFRAYLPERALAYLDPSDPSAFALSPALVEGKSGRPGKTVAYVCRGRACSAPVTEPAELEKLLADG
jgi:uncharacterized protein